MTTENKPIKESDIATVKNFFNLMAKKHGVDVNEISLHINDNCISIIQEEMIEFRLPKILEIIK